MRYLVDSLQSLSTTIVNVFRKPTTVEFPAEQRSRPARSRVSFALVHDEHGDEACIGCLKCEKICPSDIITVKVGPKRMSEATGKKRGYCADFTLDLTACIYCELCVQVCPTDAIVMTRTHQAPSFAREDMVLTMAKLYANESTVNVAWSNGSKLVAMQDPARTDDPETLVSPLDAAKPDEAAKKPAPSAAAGKAKPPAADGKATAKPAQPAAPPGGEE